MVVTNIESYQNGKYKVYLNDEFAFVLYKSELRSFCIGLGQELSEDICSKIKEEVLGKRAKLRTLHLLERMDRTEFQIRTKLREGLYPEEVIEEAIAYAKGYRYIDDKRYAQNYATIKNGTKSKRQVVAQLQQKGIHQETITNTLDQVEFDEKQAIKKQILKKRIDFDTATREEIQKIKVALIRKGFSYDTCNEVLKELSSKNF